MERAFLKLAAYLRNPDVILIICSGTYLSMIYVRNRWENLMSGPLWSTVENLGVVWSPVPVLCLWSSRKPAGGDSSVALATAP